MASIEAHNYGIIATPLTDMLRKNYLHWTAVAVTTFGELKKVMTTISILTLPDFDQLFVIECDASDVGIGAVLSQQNKPMAYFNRLMAVCRQNLPTYEKELIELVKAVKYWNSYLWGCKFIMRTNHYSLKFLLE